MIGLTFLAIGLLWLALSVLLAVKLPKWFGASKPVWRWLLGAVIFLVLLVGPFVDHIVGMRQFNKLCDEETSLQFTANAANTIRAKGLLSKTDRLSGYAIQIERDRRPIIDLDTNQEIGWYYRFRTGGGKVGGLLMLGGKHTCAIDQSNHVEHKKYLAFEVQTNFIR